jgi:hypothetical protein
MSYSPTPEKSTEVMDFPAAMQAVIGGKFITRIEWNDSTILGGRHNGILMLYINNDWHQWIVSDGDLLGQDWIVLGD